MATNKQIEAIKEITEKHRSVSGAMKEVGYSKNTYTKPKNLTESKAYKEIFGNVVTENELAEIHKKHLYSENELASLNALDKAYKVNGAYAPTQQDNRNLIVNVNVNDKYLNELAKQINGSIKRTIISSNGVDDTSMDAEISAEE